jgi:hypothetical protein
MAFLAGVIDAALVRICANPATAISWISPGVAPFPPFIPPLTIGSKSMLESMHPK